MVLYPWLLRPAAAFLVTDASFFSKHHPHPHFPSVSDQGPGPCLPHASIIPRPSNSQLFIEVSQVHQTLPSELLLLFPLPGSSSPGHKSHRTCGTEHRYPLSGKFFPHIPKWQCPPSALLVPAPYLHCCIYPTMELVFLSFSSRKQLTKGRMEVNFSSISVAARVQR